MGDGGTEVLSLEQQPDPARAAGPPEARLPVLADKSQTGQPEGRAAEASHPAVEPFKSALLADDIPFTAFAVDDIAAETQRLKGHSERFTQPPADMGPVILAVFEDGSGNLLRIARSRILAP